MATLTLISDLTILSPTSVSVVSPGSSPVAGTGERALRKLGDGDGVQICGDAVDL